MDPFAVALALTTAVFGIVLALYALHLAIQTRIECRAMKESTHNVQFVPLSPELKEQSDKEDIELERANVRGERAAMDRLQTEYIEPLN